MLIHGDVSLEPAAESLTTIYRVDLDNRFLLTICSALVFSPFLFFFFSCYIFFFFCPHTYFLIALSPIRFSPPIYHANLMDTLDAFAITSMITNDA